MTRSAEFTNLPFQGFLLKMKAPFDVVLVSQRDENATPEHFFGLHKDFAAFGHFLENGLELLFIIKLDHDRDIVANNGFVTHHIRAENLHVAPLENSMHDSVAG